MQTKHKKEIKKLPYRLNVCCIVCRDEMFLLVQLKNWDSKLWKFPQGGIGDEEEITEAALRELKEELGTDKFEVVGASEIIHQYDWDDESVELAKYKWRGQTQRFVVLNFLGEDTDIKLNKKELRAYTWCSKKHLSVFINHRHPLFIDYYPTICKVIDEFNL